MKSCLYILYSKKLDRYYIGSTNNLARRIKEHANQHTRTTRGGAYELVLSQEFETLLLARRAELKLKRWKRRDIIEAIVKDGKIKSV